MRAKLSALVVAATALSLATAGCGGDPVSGPTQPIDPNPVTELIKPKLSVSVKDGEIGHSPGIPVSARVADGKLTAVTLLNPENAPVAGKLSPDGLSWQTTEPLGYKRSYRLKAEAIGLGGASTATVSFTTSSPNNLTKPYIIPFEGEVVGVAQPVAVQFDENIPDRRAAQAAIHIVTDPPVAGAFYWINNREVRWRPEHFFAPNTKVSVHVNAYGKNLGRGLYGEADAHSNYLVGDATVYTADDHTHHVTVVRNGQQIRDMPTSMGKSGSPTDNGVYIIGARHQRIVMDSSTYGVPVNSPQGYKLDVDYATQMSYSGIYFHSAPWSLGQQGYSNASHGCLNLSPDNARWVYENAKRGDPVIVKNTVSGVLNGLDGLGDWNVPWHVWQAGNATEG